MKGVRGKRKEAANDGEWFGGIDHDLATLGRLDRPMQSIGSLYAMKGSDLPYQRACRHGELRRRAAAAMRDLRSVGFRKPQVAALLDLLRTEAARDAVVSEWPTAGEDRQALNELGQAAIALRGRLLGLSPMAAMYLNSGARDLDADDVVPDGLLADLLKLADCATRSVQDYLPAQSRARHHANVAEAVAVASRTIGLKISASPTSQFCRACAAAFELADVRSERKGTRIRPSPVASIRALMKSGNRRGANFWHLK